jgi:hypothetical protein
MLLSLADLPPQEEEDEEAAFPPRFTLQQEPPSPPTLHFRRTPSLEAALRMAAELAPGQPIRGTVSSNPSKSKSNSKWAIHVSVMGVAAVLENLVGGLFAAAACSCIDSHKESKQHLTFHLPLQLHYKSFKQAWFGRLDRARAAVVADIVAMWRSCQDASGQVCTQAAWHLTVGTTGHAHHVRDWQDAQACSNCTALCCGAAATSRTNAKQPARTGNAAVCPLHNRWPASSPRQALRQAPGRFCWVRLRSVRQMLAAATATLAAARCCRQL